MALILQRPKPNKVSHHQGFPRSRHLATVWKHLSGSQDAQMFEFRMKARHFNDDSRPIGQIGQALTISSIYNDPRLTQCKEYR
jgi:hypothetical protein